jgi:hypothetical protein
MTIYLRLDPVSFPKHIDIAYGYLLVCYAESTGDNNVFGIQSIVGPEVRVSLDL